MHITDAVSEFSQRNVDLRRETPLRNGQKIATHSPHSSEQDVDLKEMREEFERIQMNIRKKTGGKPAVYRIASDYLMIDDCGTRQVHSVISPQSVFLIERDVVEPEWMRLKIRRRSWKNQILGSKILLWMT